MGNIRILTLKFRNQLRPDEIKWFRGAVIHASDKDNVLFHNHTEENYRYAYPLIQYKLIQPVCRHPLRRRRSGGHRVFLFGLYRPGTDWREGASSGD